MNSLVFAVGGSVAFVLLLLGLFALAARHSERSWSDEEFERDREAGTATGNAFLAVQAIFDPGAQHALEQRTVERAEQVESGAPPDPGAEER